MNRKELLDYEKVCGTESAINLLLLTPPDRFEDDYDETMKELEERLYK